MEEPMLSRVVLVSYFFPCGVVFSAHLMCPAEMQPHPDISAELLPTFRPQGELNTSEYLLYFEFAADFVFRTMCDCTSVLIQCVASRTGLLDGWQ